ncbi:LYR motif-containing protein 4A-like [Xiphias gladius]|uniref:LYR motif-containing protein 4A-like n=1 Tax=Xiphias gladius TaxID=8245 RepID=UPI001A9A2AA4|nr:LYR motif-containing protein 4A-like [Xiphias gladius]
MSSSSQQVLSLYRRLIRESQKFSAYNYRSYALRRVRSSFRENMEVRNQKHLEQLLIRGRESLSLIMRQVCVGQMYGAQKMVVEK